MKVLIADKFPASKIEKIRELECSVFYKPDLEDDTLLDELKKDRYNILIVRSTRVTSEMINVSPALSLIIRAGSGYDTIDTKTASLRGIYVANCPGKNSIAVAELTFGLILSLDRRIPDNVIQIRNGKWNKKEFLRGRGIFGRTLGIIGLGRVGREMIPRAQAFGMKIVAWSRSLTEKKAEEMGIKYASSPQKVAEEADIVSIHLALTENTEGLIGKSFFNSMKRGAYFINTSRAEIVDHDALLKAINKKDIKVGLDVFLNEPDPKIGEFKDNIVDHQNVYGTHHIGGSTRQAQDAVADEVVRIVREYLTTGKVLNCVNIMKRPPAQGILIIHHRNCVGILAEVLSVIRDAKINVERMENTIFEGGKGACAFIEIDKLLSKGDLEKIKKSTNDIFFVNQMKLS